MKKVLIGIIATVLILSLVPAFALGANNTGKYQICSVESCNVEKTHKHKNVTYSGHNSKDGHSHHNNGNHGSGSKHKRGGSHH